MDPRLERGGKVGKDGVIQLGLHRYFAALPP